MTTMTDTDIVEALAKREGWMYPCKPCANMGMFYWRNPSDTGCRPSNELPDYLNDRNALQPILDGLTEEEWKRLWDELSSSHMPKNGWNWFEFLKCVLTLKPRDLAICLVKALKLGKE